jgi:hypothetical protein
MSQRVLVGSNIVILFLLLLMLEKDHNLVSIGEYIAHLFFAHWIRSLFFYVHQFRYMSFSSLSGLPDKSYALCHDISLLASVVET